VNGDGFGTPQDVLVVINELNRRAAGEGELVAESEVRNFAEEAHGRLTHAIDTALLECHSQTASSTERLSRPQNRKPAPRAEDSLLSLLPIQGSVSEFDATLPDDSRSSTDDEFADIISDDLAEDIAKLWF
jgi:hypothetical protein